METRREMLKDGLVAGVLGYATIAVFYGAVNLARGESVLATPRMLGRELVGPTLAESMPAAPVLAYNGIHLLSLLAVGMGVAWLVYETELHPRLWFVSFFAAGMGLFFSEGAFFILAESAVTVLPWWSVVGANLAAGLAVGGYLFRSHRALIDLLQEVGSEGI